MAITTSSKLGFVSIADFPVFKVKRLFEAIERLAEARAAQIKSRLTALHEPDMVAGGYFTASTSRMGLSNVNSAYWSFMARRAPASVGGMGKKGLPERAWFKQYE